MPFDEMRIGLCVVGAGESAYFIVAILGYELCFTRFFSICLILETAEFAALFTYCKHLNC